MLRRTNKHYFIGIVLFLLICSNIHSNDRDKWHQPEKVMDNIYILRLA